MTFRTLFQIFSIILICNALTDTEKKVVEAIDKAGIIVLERNGMVANMTDERDSQKANPTSQLHQLRGDLYAEITKVLIDENGEKILPELEEIDIDGLIISRETQLRAKRNALPAQGSPHALRRRSRHRSPSTTTARPARNQTVRHETGCKRDIADCNDKFHEMYRSITGICNNKVRSRLGSAVSPTRRLANGNSYEDGIGIIRSKSTTGQDLPSARFISNKIHDEGAKNNLDLTTNHFHMQFGQFIAHDVIFMPASTGPNGDSLDCSSCESARMTPNCAPITVPNDDPFFPPHSCLRLTRALNGQTGLGARQQINQNTHFLDLSVVYGSEECESKAVRSFERGRLLDSHNFEDILPPQKINDTVCRTPSPDNCFVAGDFRSTLHPGLIPLHTIYIQEHNRIAESIFKHKPCLDEETLFQEARKIMIAQYQHHVYSSYLPKLLGPKVMKDFDLLPKKSGYTKYDPSVNPSLSNEFSASAFRFGHSQARDDLIRKSNRNETIGSIDNLGDNIFYADTLYHRHLAGTESLLEGMIRMPGLKVDTKFSFPIRNEMFAIRGRKASGVDLVAINLMRGRDVGLLPYNRIRVLTGLNRALSFDDLRDDMDPENIKALQSVYATVDDIDLYAGLLSERPTNGALIGLTGQFIIGEGFSALKKGDRFYYEHEGNFTPEELDAIRRSKLAKVLCQNSKFMENINENIFDFNSKQIKCSSIPNLNAVIF